LAGQLPQPGEDGRCIRDRRQLRGRRPPPAAGCHVEGGPAEKEAFIRRVADLVAEAPMAVGAPA
jgi:hypothetical protein